MSQVKRLIPQLSEEQIRWFWSMVENSLEGDPEPCWPWVGRVKQPTKKHRNLLPYGECALPGGVHPAHRVAYFIWTDEQPGRLVVRHECHNPVCCNPYHLVVGTALENIEDMKRAGRDNFWGYRNKTKTT